MKNNIAINSQLNKWFIFQKSLDWRDDRIYLKNIRNAFREAFKFGIWFQSAINIVTTSIYRSGRSVDSTELKQVWRLVLDEWEKQNKQVILLPPASLPPRNGIGSQNFRDTLCLVKIDAPESAKRVVAVDGTNVLFGSISNPNPSLLNLLGLVLELKQRGFVAKCFFDANTFHQLVRAGKTEEALAFKQLCHEFPDNFIIVAGGNRADDFLLDFADSEKSPVISNDLFRDYHGQYPWLIGSTKHRVSFLVHSGIMQIVGLGIRAAIPASLAVGLSLLRSALWKPATPARIESRPMKRVTANHGGANGTMEMAA